MLDRELVRRKPIQGPHGEVVGTAIVDGELFGKVIQRVKAVVVIKPLLIFPVTAPHLAVVARCVGTDELMPDTKLSGSGLKQSRQIPFTVGESVGELKSIIRLDALHPDAPTGIPPGQHLEEVSGRIGALFRVGSEETQTGKLINGCVLEQAALWVCNTFAGHYLHIYLNTLSGIGHLFVRLGFVSLFLLCWWKQAKFAQDPE